MDAPCKVAEFACRQMRKDHRGARQMGGAGDDLSGMPAVILQDAGGIAGILDRVERVRFFKENGCRHALRLRYASHHLGFDKPIMSCRSGNDDPWRNASLVLMDAFGDAILKFRRGIAIAVGGSAEHDNCVEGLTSSIAFRCETPRQ